MPFYKSFSRALSSHVPYAAACLPTCLAACLPTQCQQQHFSGSPPRAWALGGWGPGSWAAYLLRSYYGVLAPPHLHHPASDAAGCSCMGGPPAAARDGRQPASAVASTPPPDQPQQQEQQRRWVQDCLGRGLSSGQLQQQAHFALAVGLQGRLLLREVERLEAAVSELLQAGRAGLFSSS